MPAVVTRDVRTWRVTAAIVAGACIAFAIVLDVALAALLPIWKDEAFTLVTTGRTVGYAFERAVHFEQNAPLYFVLMTVWRVLDNSVLFARLFSVICVAGTLVLAYGLSQRYVPSISPAWFVAAIAFNPFVVWAATEIRLYALAMLLSAALMRLFADGFLDERPNSKARAAFFAVAVLALWTQYFFVLLLAGLGATLLITRRWRALLIFSGLCALAVATCLPLAHSATSATTSFRGAFAGFESPFDALRLILGMATQNVIPREWLPGPMGGFYVAFFVGILVGLAVTMRPRDEGFTVLATMSFVTFAAFLAAVYVVKEPVLNRHLAFAFIPMSLLVFSFLAGVRSKEGLRSLPGGVVALWTLLMIVTSAASLAAVYHPLAKEGDAKREAAYVAAHERPHEPILIFPADEALPFQYYYRGINRVVPLPQPVSTTVYNMAAFRLDDAGQIERVLAGAPNHRRTFWLASLDYCTINGLNLGCGTLEDFVAQRTVVLRTEHFYKSTLRLLRLRDGVR